MGTAIQPNSAPVFVGWRIEAGEWQPPPARFTGWRVEGGDWQPTPDGALPADLPRGVIEVQFSNGVSGGRFTIVNTLGA